MAVEVIRGYEQSGAEKVETFDEGHSFEVSEAHLLVRSRPTSSTQRGKVIGAFAPAAWAFARHHEGSTSGD